MRALAALSIAALGVLGLLTYEIAVLSGIAVAIGFGLVNFVLIGRQARAIKELQESQGARIDRLPPPPGG